ncbi:pyridoxamine 5'-phosphate oxidase family protein [Halobellus sp. GM3]|uniref:pyridoxamine 5'-phosphate oxidase family protein n=1 Tax=Halobellus sp. GM3 TaxID=3458410 RepID=UPI00403E344F
MKHVDYAYTLGMDDDDVEERLRGVETGVLALARDGESYAIPLAHYYDGESLYFRLGVTEGSRKREFLRSTGTATYVLYEAEATSDPQEIDTWSVLVTGRLVELPASERDRFDTAEINSRFSPIRVFDEAIDEIEIVIYELEIDSVTGRKTPEE